MICPKLFLGTKPDNKNWNIEKRKNKLSKNYKYKKRRDYN